MKGRRVCRTREAMACRVLIVVAAAGVLAGGEQVVAQQGETDGEVTVLTLQEALDRAAAYNPQYRQAVNRMDLAEPQRREALGRFLPNLSIDYSTGHSFSRETTALDIFGNPLPNPEVRTITRSRSSQGASMGIQLFSGGSRFHQLGQARAQARFDRLSASRELNTILAEVHRQFLTAQRQKARLEVELELLAARERDVELTTRLFELASIGLSDLLATELDLEAQRLSVNTARADFRKGLLALRKAIGDPSLAALDVQQRQPEPFDPADLDVDGLVGLALRESPSIGAANAELDVSRAALNMQRGDRWPTVTLGAGVSGGTFGVERTALFDFFPDGGNGGLTLSVDLPIFNRFTTSRAIAAADVDLRNANEALRQTELDLEEQIRARYVDLETAWASLRERTRRLEIATERLGIVQEEYRLATKSIEDLRAAIREEAAALRDALDQRFEFAGALLGLYEAAGIVGQEAGIDTSQDPN
ncbi:MAG: TolC family protein [Gemmatimonadota bacterium]|nr:TolC family protein [Gemmatimonadota bacterium]